MEDLLGRKLTGHYQSGPTAYLFGSDKIIRLNAPDAMVQLGNANDIWEITQDGSGIMNWFYDGTNKDYDWTSTPEQLQKRCAPIHRADAIKFAAYAAAHPVLKESSVRFSRRR